MIDYIDKDYSEFYGANSDFDTKKTNNRNQIFDLDTESIRDNSLHYFCTKCLKFPFIKFCKDKKNIRLTCSCFNNKKFLIDDLFLKDYPFHFSIKNKNFFSTEKDDNNIGYENILLCEKHKKIFKGFSTILMENYCQKCINKKFKYDNIINFEEIKIKDEIELQLLSKINELNVNYTNNIDNNIDIFKIIQKNNSYCEKLSEMEAINFQKLINIIINDYKKYPNFSNFFNIKNLLYFFNIEDNQEIEKKINAHNLIKSNEPIIIEYINNISNKTKLFSKIFVKNNIKRFKIEIEGKIMDLIEDYKFKTKEKIVRVKLYKNKNVSEINMYKMFSNCTNLIYVNGISKLKKIININKIFYNCISLSSIPDFKEWEIEKYNGYLCFIIVFLWHFFHMKEN